VSSAFDTPLGIRNVFSLLADFISEWQAGCNLAITPFPPITMAPGQSSSGKILQNSSTASGGTLCAFTNGVLPGVTAFTPYADGACVVPQDLVGIAYINLARTGPLTGVLTEAIAVAGPLVLQIS
jgi:hypothetical protein